MSPSYEQLHHESPERALSVATSVASYYGFSPVASLPASAQKRAVKVRAAERELDGVGGELVNGFVSFASSGYLDAMPPYAVQFHHSRFARDLPAPHGTRQAGKERRSRDSTFLFGLHVAGSGKSIAEAIVIRTALTVLEEMGFPDLSVRVNSIGDKDSVARFTRELVNFFKRRAGEMPSSLLSLSRERPWDALAELHEKGLPLSESAPRSVDFLSEASRRHFREVLTYLDAMEVPYVMDERIMGARECYSQILFRIESGSEHPGVTRVAEGGRYDQLGKSLGLPPMPAVGALLSFLVSGSPRRGAEEKAPREKKPKFFFVQLGFEAKLASFPLLEKLRKARLAMKTSLSLDELHAQLKLAEESKAAYVVIVGHKEAHDGTALVRTLATHAQETVPAAELPAYLKTLP
jgi:histidyl-tRNA synthetase